MIISLVAFLETLTYCTSIFPSSDPFVKLLLNNRLFYTSHSIKNNINPIWNEVCTLTCPLEVPLDQCTLVVEVYDYDNMSDHDLLGRVAVTGKLNYLFLFPRLILCVLIIRYLFEPESRTNNSLSYFF